MTEEGHDPRLTVVIVNWNAREELLRCLRCLPNAVRPVPTRVLVVDNASTDGSATAVRRNHPDVQVLESGENLGFGGGIEAGRRRAAGAFLIALNPDVFPEPGSLAALVDLLESRPLAALAGPEVLDREGRPVMQDFTLPGLGSALGRLPGIPALRRALRQPVRPGPRRVERVNGCCMAFRRSLLEAAGGFPREAFLYGEEIALGGALRRAGFEVWYLPSARVVHWDGASVDQLWSAGDKLLVFKAARILTSRGVMGRGRFVLWNGIFMVREVLYWLLRPLARLAGRSWPPSRLRETTSLHALGAASAVSPAALRRLRERYERHLRRDRGRDR